MTDTVVPDVATAALPADSVALSRVIGDSGYGLVAEDATSTLTVSPILAVSVYAGTWMRGLSETTTSTGICALTVLLSSSVTLTAIDPAEPFGVPSGADTVRVVPDRDAVMVDGEESIA